MNIEYPITEILQCIEIINQPKKEFYKDSHKTINLNNTVGMKKKINQTQGTFGEPFETEELIEETFDDAQPFEIDEITKVADDAQPFEIDEITKINDLGMKKNKKKKTKPIIRIKE